MSQFANLYWPDSSKCFSIQLYGHPDPQGVHVLHRLTLARGAYLTINDPWAGAWGGGWGDMV